MKKASNLSTCQNSQFILNIVYYIFLHLKFNLLTHQKWLPYQILGGKSVKETSKSIDKDIVEKAKHDVVNE